MVSGRALRFDSSLDAAPDSPVYRNSGVHLPVFEAFNTLGLTGTDVAEVAQVTAPTVSKWRNGTAQIPGKRLSFLTLVLAHMLDEMQIEKDSPQRQKIEAARADLVLQDVLNQELPVADIRQGVQDFRRWWSSPAAACLLEKRLSKMITNDLDMLKMNVSAKDIDQS